MAASNSENDVKTEVPSSNEAEQPQIQAIRMPSMEEIRAQDVWNNCAVRSVASGVMGGGLGFMMGVFLGALDNPIMQDQMSGKQQLIYSLKQMGQRSWGSAKTFAVMGVVFSAVECVVEKARAKHDATNTVVAGCVTGGTMSAKADHLSLYSIKNLVVAGVGIVNATLRGGVYESSPSAEHSITPVTSATRSAPSSGRIRPCHMRRRTDCSSDVWRHS